ALLHPLTRFPIPGDGLVEKGHPRYDEANQRVTISADNVKSGKQGQYFDGVPPEVWRFQVGGYQPCHKWLKDRVGRQLTYDDLTHYQRMVVALHETIRLMAEIDDAIPEWPIA
ncbi:MAG TPA: type ISP restriction/modification enzyme, partial [Anaerolineae bacterium]|nr:type ISP restriction/modification enzyme [Anaerolineae bacterium]